MMLAIADYVSLLAPCRDVYSSVGQQLQEFVSLVQGSAPETGYTREKLKSSWDAIEQIGTAADSDDRTTS